MYTQAPQPLASLDLDGDVAYPDRGKPVAVPPSQGLDGSPDEVKRLNTARRSRVSVGHQKVFALEQFKCIRFTIHFLAAL